MYCQNHCRNIAYHIHQFFFIFWHDFLTQCDYFKAENIIIEGNELIPDEEILKETQLYKGINILAINLSKTRKKLLTHPWIAEARVARVLPSEIHIIINEHKPFAILNLGRQFILNSEGEIFKEWEDSDPNDLPVVTGINYADLPAHPGNSSRSGEGSGRVFDALMDLLQLGEETESVIPNRLIEHIEVDREMGITLKLKEYAKIKTRHRLKKRSDISVSRLRIIKLGYNDYRIKYERLKTILFYLKENSNLLPLDKERRKGFSKIDSVDLNNLNRIIINCDQLSVISDIPFTTDH